MDLVGLLGTAVLSVGTLLYVNSYSMTCTLTLYVSGVSGNIFDTGGHAFVSVKNNSMITVSVGYMPVSSLGEVTIGTWGNISSHSGVWYNVESHRYQQYGTFATNVAISTTFDLATLGIVNNYIINNNDTWSLTFNCSTFAAGLWNTLSSDSVNTGLFNNPSGLYNSVVSKSNYLSNLALPSSGATGYYISGPTFVPDNGDGN